MSTDYSNQLSLLRELYERVQKKETIDPEVYKEAGVKDKARLKDIEKAISATKKKVSCGLKKEITDQEEKELEDLAKDNNMTLEDFKKRLEEEKLNARTGGDASTRERGLADARAKKVIAREMDIED